MNAPFRARVLKPCYVIKAHEKVKNFPLFKILTRYQQRWDIELKLRPLFLGGVMEGARTPFHLYLFNFMFPCYIYFRFKAFYGKNFSSCSSVLYKHAIIASLQVTMQ